MKYHMKVNTLHYVDFNYNAFSILFIPKYKNKIIKPL